MEDLTGEKFGRLFVLSFFGLNKNSRSLWNCRCDCGKETVVVGYKLKSGHTRSCGCLAIEARTNHGLRHHPLYAVWSGMKQRCYNPNASRYNRYGGRGITVCQSWRDSFESFFSDMVHDYKKGLQLDRIDNEKGYCKENCRWVTPATNVKNRESTIFYEGVCLKDYCKQHNLNYNTVASRINQYHWTVEQSLLSGNYQGKRGM